MTKGWGTTQPATDYLKNRNIISPLMMPSLQDNQLGFIPRSPEGALLYGVLVANHRVRGRLMPLDWLLASHAVSSSVASIRLCALPRAIHSMIGSSEPDAIRQVLEKNTVFGFYEKGLTATRARSWLQSIAQHASRSGPRYRVHGQRIGHLDGLRWCKSCAEMDLADGMLPSWRVVHQLPFVHHCPEHKQALLSHCAKCGAAHDPGCNSRLPADPCRICGSSASNAVAVKTSDGYWDCVNFAADLHQGAYPGMRADAWWDVFASVLVTESRYPTFRQRIREVVLSRWDACDEDALVNSVRFELASPLKLEGFDASTFSSSLFERIILAEALATLGLIDSHESLKCQATVARRATGRTAVDDLAISALNFGIPPGVGTSLARKSDRSVICRQYRLAPETLQRFIASIPVEHINRVEAQAGIIMPRTSPSREFALRLRGSTDWDSRREEYRGRILQFLREHEGANRRDIQRRCLAAFRWLKANDSEWLESNIPKRWAKVIETNRPLFRARAESFVQAHPQCNRTNLARAEGQVYTWLLRNDIEWLNSLIPSRRTKDGRERLLNT